ncbi:MAG TPA: hypothetical protein PLI28_00160 [Petrotogaceae bacterium]|jgi:hypothetical protein|nr:hypothetical protein [Petrotogaceae bacterium]HQP57365.1 hypothetical protein [Petrotogaceae bacterium]
MDRILIKEDIIPETEELLKLYNDAQWSAYTNDSYRLKNAFRNSLKVFIFWDTDKL